MDTLRVTINRDVLRLVCPSVLLQSARGRVATAAKPVAVSRVWYVEPVIQRTHLFNGFKI